MYVSVADGWEDHLVFGPAYVQSHLPITKLLIGYL